jgi:hypothetical protein
MTFVRDISAPVDRVQCAVEHNVRGPADLARAGES